MADRALRPPTARFGVVDALRGAALCGMVAYHVEWDLAALGWPVVNPTSSLAWTVLGDLVAATFLTLSGVALALARSKGARAASRRLVRLALAGVSVTGASLWVAPNQPILFGILQCLAVSDLIGLVALRWPAPVRLGAAALAILTPMLWRSPAFDGWPLAALGLGIEPPPTLDFRPLLPWLAGVLVGTVVGEALLRRSSGDRERVGPGSLCWLGRNSLAVYLLHQPMLYGALLLIRLALGGPALDADPFTLQCRSDCASTGVATRLCRVACACTAERLAAETTSANHALSLTPHHLDAVAQACRAAGG
jgi:uncharacterized membrane protein